jgi:hypothetical protein
MWKLCGSTAYEKVCADYTCISRNDNSGTCSKLSAAKAFVTLACILSGISALCLFACIVTTDNIHRMLLLAAKGLVFASLITGIIGVAVGISATTDLANTLFKSSLGAAAIIGIVALIINLSGAIVALLVK